MEVVSIVGIVFSIIGVIGILVIAYQNYMDEAPSEKEYSLI